MRGTSMSIAEVIEEQKFLIQRQAEQIACLSILLHRYVEQEEIDRILKEKSDDLHKKILESDSGKNAADFPDNDTRSMDGRQTDHGY